MRKILVLSIALFALSTLAALAAAPAEPPATQAVAQPAVTAPAAEAPAPPAVAGELLPAPDFLTPCPTPQLLACWRSCGQSCTSMGCSSNGAGCSLEHGCTCSCLCL